MVRRPGGRRRLVYLLQRYDGAIAADLADRGLDLAVLFTARRWRYLLQIIDHLPRTSHFMCAVADDDEIAEGMAPPKPGPPPLRDWSPEVERLTLLVDQIAALIALTATAHGSKKKPPKPLPRPRTAYDRIKARRRTETADHIRELVKPAPGKPTMAEGRPDPRSQMTRKR